MKQFLWNLWSNRKTEVAAIGAAGLCVYQLSQQDWTGAAATAGLLANALGLKLQFAALLPSGAGVPGAGQTPPGTTHSADDVP